MFEDKPILPLSQPSQDSREPAKKPPTAEHPRVKFLAFMLLILLSVAGGVFGGWIAVSHQSKLSPAIQKEKVILQSQGELISNIADEVGQSVVSVTVTSSGNDFFGFNSEAQSAGTGFILTEDGLIITNRHVVPANATKVNVTLADGTEYENVTIIGRTGTNDSLDIAFLKIPDTKGKVLKPAKIGSSAAVKVGEPVVAIGNALGQFQNTVTYGIISGYGRSVQATSEDASEVDSLENLFQTDAAINPGNSGGPLVNLNGEVIGINTAVASGGAQNIGFAIPIDDVSGLMKSVKEKGKLERPFLGVFYVPLTNDVAKAYNLSINRGAYIAPASETGSDGVLDGGPADKAGIKEGDIIAKIDDAAIDQSHSLSALVNKHSVGDKIKLTIHRDGQDQTVEVTLGAAPTD